MNSFCISSKLIETRGGGDLDLSSDGNVTFARKKLIPAIPYISNKFRAIIQKIMKNFLQFPYICKIFSKTRPMIPLIF